MYRVVFPFELKLPNTTDDAAGRDALYSLFAVVVHVGSGPHHGEVDRDWLRVAYHMQPGLFGRPW